MLMFILTISCLATSNLPWLMDLSFQVPMQYCSLQYQIFTFTTSQIHNWALFPLWPRLFILSGIISLLFPSSILDTSYLEDSSSGVISFWLFVLFMGFLRQEYWSGLPFPSPVDHVLSELSTMTHPSWVWSLTHSMITQMMWSLTQSQTSWIVKSSGP